MRYKIIILCLLISMSAALQADVTHSEKTQACLECHASLHPGLVADWLASSHARTSLAEAFKREGLERKISVASLPAKGTGTSIGCAECHTLNPDSHGDTVNHADYKVHTVVTPEDCAACHPVERDEFRENVMSRAHGNLMGNPVYADLVKNISGVPAMPGNKLSWKEPSAENLADSCLFCHGTEVKVKKKVVKETDFGDVEVPVLTGWPNQGTGRVNPDSSLGSCAACHTRHLFSVETARKPATCGGCHKGPDVPAYKVYKVSKHGALYDSHSDKYNFSAVPWVVGRDFTAPTCAACHMSLITDTEGNVLAKRSHMVADRLEKRIFGLIYSHAHPKSPDTTIIKHKSGLPLPTGLDGTEAEEYLISKEEQEKRLTRMKTICLGCHSAGWTEGHFAKLDASVSYADSAVKVATGLLVAAWDKEGKGYPSKISSIFDEHVERLWIKTWLFYANSVRFAAAMAGADYGTFADGRWQLNETITEIERILTEK